MSARGHLPDDLAQRSLGRPRNRAAVILHFQGRLLGIPNGQNRTASTSTGTVSLVRVFSALKGRVTMTRWSIHMVVESIMGQHPEHAGTAWRSPWNLPRRSTTAFFPHCWATCKGEEDVGAQENQPDRPDCLKWWN